MTPDLLKRVRDEGHTVFDDRFQLNIIGIRSPNRDQTEDLFDDVIHVIYRDHFMNWVSMAFPATTDPGRMWLERETTNGTAILKAGQYTAWKIDKHRGKYLALCQRLAAVPVFRDRDRTAELTLNPQSITTGFFGINIHKSSKWSENIGPFSAGCSVFQSELHFEIFMSLCHAHAALYSNKFTYTLLED